MSSFSFFSHTRERSAITMVLIVECNFFLLNILVERKNDNDRNENVVLQKFQTLELLLFAKHKTKSRPDVF